MGCYLLQMYLFSEQLFSPSLVPQGYVESHTADQRLGLMSEGQVTDHPSYSAHLVSASNPSPVEAGMEDCLDRNTTLSRSFKSSHLFQELILFICYFI